MEAKVKKGLMKLGKSALISLIDSKIQRIDELSQKCRECRNECPLPICDLPELLSKVQMQMALVYLDMPYKIVANDLHVSTGTIFNGLYRGSQYPKHHKTISDYLKKKLIEKAIL